LPVLDVAVERGPEIEHGIGYQFLVLDTPGFGSAATPCATILRPLAEEMVPLPDNLRDALSRQRSEYERNVNKILHGIVLVFFGAACWLVWALLQLPLMVRVDGAVPQLPGFTRLCMEFGPGLLVGLAASATAYCLWVWFGKAEQRPSWVGFLATATGSLLLVTLVVVVAIHLPLITVLNNLKGK
jgi:hypothetical protein